MASKTRMTCALKVDTNSSGWHKTTLKVLKKIKGVTYDIDVKEGMAYVSGKVDPHTILKKLVKGGKHAELCWVEIGDLSRTNDSYGLDYPRDHSHWTGYQEDSYWDGYGQRHNSYFPYQPLTTQDYLPHSSYPYYY